ncbi:MAG TPA: PSD1 and planctomycete cytochrome C domain-containing protein [Polyangiaceae bacterium]|nr:PSD1 and planctomycete cytochrome C domain-containing protein [Polyangiaceae bacterium]
MKAGLLAGWRAWMGVLVVFGACSAPEDSDPPPSFVPRELCTPIADDGTTVYFFSDIQPILGDRCVRCHGGVRELGSPRLNLQSREKAGFVLGSAGDVCSSEFFRRIAIADPGLRMPLGGQALPPEKVQALGNWILRGAAWPRHWAFAPLAEIEPRSVPVKDEAWIKTPIDRFILARLEREGIKPSPEADRTTLLRRVSLDLTGLPPTPSAVDAFMADTSAAAYEKVVDRLLQSPSFGERWGAHWLDQAHYGDTDGFEADHIRPNAWRWRDWVIDALNRDQPFDEFTIEQLAGDLLPGRTSTQVLATGFLRQTLYNGEDGVDLEEDRTKRVVDRVSTVGATWLGLTLGCAQCHSHPYDPIAQKEFYQLYAFFNNANESTADVPGSGSSAAGPGDVMMENTARPTYLLIRGDFRNPDTREALTQTTPRILHPFQSRQSGADRLDLARWLVDRTNPLTPRVTVNTIWYHLFGQGIVATLDDFGSRARLPSHPELLDWLARDFVGNEWRRKRVIKQIVMSATYRQSAEARPDVAPRDPDNALLARQNRVRVEAEIVTDTALAVSGLLTDRVGGPCVYPPIPDEVLNITLNGTEWGTSSPEDQHRRGLYTFYKRTVPYPNLQVFDHPSSYASAPGRERSNTPLQALTTLHNVVFAEAARALARRVQTEVPLGLREQLVWAFRLTVARRPEEDEISELESLFQDSARAYELDPQGAKDAVGDYMPPQATAAAAAAWVATARVILNLDEAITKE